jgi:hypothetical protein
LISHMDGKTGRNDIQGIRTAADWMRNATTAYHVREKQDKAKRYPRTRHHDRAHGRNSKYARRYGR